MKMKCFNIAILPFVFLILTILNFAITTEIQAQCETSIVDIIPAPVQQLTIADIDFDHFESATLLFTMRLGPSAGGDTVRLHIVLNIKLANRSTYLNAADYTSKSFFVPPAGATYTNLDIGRSIQRQEFKLDSRAKEDVQDVALATGKFPAGIYTFQIAIICSDNSQLSGPPIDIVLLNSSRVDLLSPQEGEMTNEFPLFEFFHDGNRAVLTVAEKNPEQSREEAISHEPPMVETELMGQNSFLYSGGRHLEFGKTYAWKVVSKTAGPGGTDVEVSSSIRLFTVSSSPQIRSEDFILTYLKDIYGNRYPKIFQNIDKDNFLLTGTYIYNGHTYTREDLLKLLNELSSMSDSIELSFE